MMTRMLFCTVTCCLTGCGTLLNFTAIPPAHPDAETLLANSSAGMPAAKEIYGGVYIDALAGKGWFEEATLDPPKALLGHYVWTVDLPLSAIGDTLTLPFTIPAEVERGVNEYYEIDHSNAEHASDQPD